MGNSKFVKNASWKKSHQNKTTENTGTADVAPNPITAIIFFYF
jgi:hypothetical protein